MSAAPADVRALLEDPTVFARRVLKADLWSVQEEILRAVVRHKKVAVKACHASGKTFVAADLALWWLARYDDGKVITTGPTGDQVRELLWAEIHTALERSILDVPLANLTDIHLGPDNYALGRSTNKAVRFQGFHGRNVLILVDEAPGLEAAIYQAIDGIAAGGNVHVVLFGNPIIPSGHFYDACTKHRKTWHVITISAFDTPNLQGLYLRLPATDTAPEEIVGDPAGRDILSLSPEELEANPRPDLTTRSWVVEKYHEWGPHGPLFQSKVLARFPTQAANALIPLAWAERAVLRGRQRTKPRGWWIPGLDVGAGGDDCTALALRSPDWFVLPLTTWTLPEPHGEATRVLQALGQWVRPVAVDTIGVGFHLATLLRRNKLKAINVNVAEAARHPDRFHNRRAELWWGLREVFRDDLVALPDDEELVGELASVLYFIDTHGRIQIESKDDAAKRGVPSPNKGDALMLTVAAGGMPREGSPQSSVPRRMPRPQIRQSRTVRGM